MALSGRTPWPLRCQLLDPIADIGEAAIHEAQNKQELL